MIEGELFRALSPAERKQREREGEARAAAQLGLSVATLNQLIAGPPRPPLPRRRERCPARHRPL
jgi:hypothetical protein